MKATLTTILTVFVMIIPASVFAQDGDTREDYKISFVTDVNFSSSSNNSKKESKSGIGTLGLNFEKGYVYGGTSFTVYSQNNEITSDSGEIKVFGTNLLLPENSSGKISNFSIRLGVKTFCLKKDSLTAVDVFDLKRIGASLEFKVNNNTWTKDSVSTPVTINTVNLNVTYILLNAEVFNTKERIKLILFGGLTTRRIGGDMGLKSNAGLRKAFLGTNERGFNGYSYGARLEISRFYGEMNMSNFSRKHDIEGFSGNQPLITIGLKADLTLFAKEMGVTLKTN